MYNGISESQIGVRHIVPGRVAAIRLPASSGLVALEVINVHLDVHPPADPVLRHLPLYETPYALQGHHPAASVSYTPLLPPHT